MTTPLSRIRSTTSTKLDDAIVFSTAMLFHLPSTVMCPRPLIVSSAVGTRGAGMLDLPGRRAVPLLRPGKPSPKTIGAADSRATLPQENIPQEPAHVRVVLHNQDIQPLVSVVLHHLVPCSRERMQSLPTAEEDANVVPGWRAPRSARGKGPATPQNTRCDRTRGTGQGRRAPAGRNTKAGTNSRKRAPIPGPRFPGSGSWCGAFSRQC